MEPAGEVTATFDTTFDTMDEDVFASGTGTLAGDFGPVHLAPLRVGATAGFDPEPGSEETDPLIMVVAVQPDHTYFIVWALVPVAEFVAGAVLPLGGGGVEVWLGYNWGSPDEEAWGPLIDGELRLVEAEGSTGAPVIGELSGTLLLQMTARDSPSVAAQRFQLRRDRQCRDAVQW